MSISRIKIRIPLRGAASLILARLELFERISAPSCIVIFES